MKKLLWTALLIGSASLAQAALKTEKISYKDGKAQLEGYLAYDDAISAPRPGVLVVHEWMGLGDNAKKRAEMLAQMGYVAFAADMYGKGVYAKDHEEAAKLSGLYRSDRKLMRQRITAGLNELKKSALIDKNKIAAIGYCFGGTSVIELARSGADVRGVVSFHGGLDSPNPADGKNIKAKVLVFHGANDGFISKENVEAFSKEMRDANVDWQMVVYGNAVHSFTVKEAGDDPSKGMAYNENADRRSWQAMNVFFAEIFK